MTRAVRPVADLIRFVVGPDGEAVPDFKNKLPGRGVWVTATQDALDDAIKRKVFARGFKRDVRLPPDLLGRTGQLLERSALDALAIAGKAGSVVAGFAKVETALAHSEGRRPPACGRGRAGRGRQACRGSAPKPVSRVNYRDAVPDLGPIGFGTGPPKCDTCSPACRAFE